MTPRFYIASCAAAQPRFQIADTIRAMRLTRRALNTIHALTLAGCLLILAMTVYSWRASGRLDRGSIAIVVLIVALVGLQRLAHRQRSDSAE